MLNYLLKRKLRYQAGHPNRKRETHTLRTARSIALLFDATQTDFRQEAIQWARRQEHDGKKVYLLGYFDHRQPPDNPGFPFFSKKQRALNGTWNTAALETFVREKPDLMVTLNPNDLLAIAYPSLLAQARMKVGAPTSWPQDYDLMIEIPDKKGLEFFFEQMNVYLDKLHTNK